MTTPIVLDPLAAWICACLLSVLMCHAAASKAMDRWMLVQHLSAYRVPDAWLTPMSVLLPALEGLAGLGLLSAWRGPAALLCALLLAVYAAAMAWHVAAGRQLDCGCGGEPLPLSWALVARNLLLMVMCALAAAEMTEREMQWADRAVVCGAVLLGSLLWAAFHQVLRQMRHTQAA